ncbi:MepB family protein [Chryseobacterium sp. Ch-15]|uniref:MepB family protein n=1 Tax=Chryseobacterium muglaense TaxID=2893752 RepID=A0A9Q3UTG5_9FLAO|nr:MepB family protein [Chryseobacterium muglaense]MBD3906167.1 MepB family protein [Chryseobacterium muglaense]MCC9033723.1 MepB family protein [Chryseobacterium muglaense]MCM2554798.1 MepB family protein [Chryseobacterium muglaense]
MTTLLEKLQTLLFSNLGLVISNLHQDQESKEYFGCNFQLNSFQIKFRKAKVTPTKVGQFVTLWKRNPISKETEPFTSEDPSDFYLILTETSDNFGFFLFTKDVLIKNQILSTDFKDGKRGFRVYPNWDIPQNKQATKTQNWQTQFFINFDDENYVERFESILKSKTQ